MVPPAILMTVDVEDWFQVENFKEYIPFSSWPSCELRVEKNVHRILDLLDSLTTKKLSGKMDSRKLCATFFILGWLAERLPQLVREIHNRGHEVASHGYFHKLCSNESRESLKKDLEKSKKQLEDIIGHEVAGYRAPSFSVNDEVLKLIEECGYRYDSSFNSFEMHGRYGHLNISQKHKDGVAVKISDRFYELPVSNLKIGNHILPWGGGGYFRLMPFSIFKQGVQAILKRDNAYIFYMHPWEIDPDQPRVHQASSMFKFRHYVNLHSSEMKINRLIKAFDQCRFVSSIQYLKSLNGKF